MKDYEPLRQFVELSRLLHFGRAARACHISASALSRAVQRLEAEVGEALFEREHHKVTLTPAGEAFRRHAVGVLEEWQHFASERISAQGELSGTLHVYCTVTAAQSIVPDLLARVRGMHPGIRIELATGYSADAIDQLRGGEIDVSIAALPDQLPAGIRSHVLTSTRIVFVAPGQGPVFATAMRRPLDWSRLPLVLPAIGLAREQVDAWLTERGIAPVVYSEIQGHEAILSLVALGCGVGVVPRLVLEKSALRDRIVEIPVRPMLGSFRIGVCVRERSLTNPLVAAVWDAVS
ncbi:MAG TPA: HTH-type transcriptional activator IlvY [Acidimicrobiales bacterium]|nr:HTH-type transcriptional activator IlvY [Acidimicrobiales bacterium]